MWRGTSVAVVLLWAAACGSDSTTETRSGGEGSSEVPAGASPIEALLAEAGVSGTDVALERRVEDLVVTCMSERGFDYTAHAIGAGSDDVAPGADLADEDFAARWGFGWLIVVDTGSAATDFVDPNDAYLETLSAVERDEWYITLYGDQPQIEGIESEEELEDALASIEPSGCYHEATTEVYGTGETADRTELLIRLGDVMGDMEERFSADPQVEAVIAEFGTCMSDAGFPMVGTDDVRGALDAIVTELNDAYASIDGSDEGQSGGSQSEDPDGAADAFEAARVDAEDAERDLAIAAASCGMSPRTMELRQLEDLRHRYEEQLIEDKADLFDELRSSAGGA